jgi:hypothetical protein
MNQWIASVLAIGFLASAVPAQADDPAPAPAPSAAPAAAPAQTPVTPAMQKLLAMFSPEIKATLNACREQGGVNLAAGAQTDGAVLCANGETRAEIPYDTYLTTVSDMAAAVSLVGLRTVISTNSGVSADRVVNFLASPDGTALLQKAVQNAIARSSLLPVSSGESATLLADQVIGRLVPTMQSTNNLVDLVGTTEQYGQVVTNFCNLPGMSVAEAQQAVPGLSPIQLYAVCVQESGLAAEVQQRVNRRS